MKFTLSWLLDHLETDASLAQIVDILPMVGLEVESLVNPREALAPFSVAEIITAEQHPNADRLRVCSVNAGDKILSIVCGAPNARAGLKTVLAPTGSYVPGAGITIKAGKIRGEISEGMLCSPAELGLSEDVGGIIELETDAPVGVSLAEYAEQSALIQTDPVIEIAITPNRGDCLGVRGVARDLAAAGMGTLKAIDFSPAAGEGKSPISWHIDDSAVALVPLVTGRMFSGVKNGPSPKWLADRLTAIGQRPISALVDITNYIMFDLGRPLHAYDGDKITGRHLTITANSSGQEILALNEKTYQTETGMLVIGDDTGPDDIAGVMGGERTGVSDSTSNMFLEIAVFDPVSVATTGRKLNLHSDARYRFERGLDQAGPEQMAGYIARFVKEICGGSFSELTVAGNQHYTPKKIAFSVERTRQLTGVDVPEAEQRRILEQLGFTVSSGAADSWSVTVPSWRNDIDGSADLVEEIIRIYGFDKLNMTELPRSSVIARPAYSAEQKRAPLLRRLLTARGITEAVTFSFLKSDDAALFGGGDDSLRLANPISTELDMMRPSILPNLLQAVSRNNNRGIENVSLFEIGPIFLSPDETGQRISVSAIRQGNIRSADWRHTATPVSAFDSKADILAALSLIGVSVDNITTSRDAPDWMHPGRSGRLKLGKMDMGYFGEIHPAILAHYDLKSPIVGFEFWLDTIALPRQKGPMKPLLNLSALQPVSRDFAFIVDQDVEAQALMQSIRKAARDVVIDVQVFDLYQGEHVEAGKKSVALTATFQPKTASFTDEELKSISDSIITTVGKNNGGKIRGA
jgi:phenylalanyl-tRNA synthetase beta chain